MDFHVKLKHCSYQTLSEEIILYTVKENLTHLWATSSTTGLQSLIWSKSSLHVLMSRVGQGLLGPL